MDLKTKKQKLQDADKEKTRLEEQVKMIEKQKKDLKSELKEMDLDDFSKVDAEIEKLNIELDDAIKKIEAIEVGDMKGHDYESKEEAKTDPVSLDELGL